MCTVIKWLAKKSPFLCRDCILSYGSSSGLELVKEAPFSRFDPKASNIEFSNSVGYNRVKKENKTVEVNVGQL